MTLKKFLLLILFVILVFFWAVFALIAAIPNFIANHADKWLCKVSDEIYHIEELNQPSK